MHLLSPYVLAVGANICLALISLEEDSDRVERVVGTASSPCKYKDLQRVSCNEIQIKFDPRDKCGYRPHGPVKLRLQKGRLYKQGKMACYVTAQYN